MEKGGIVRTALVRASAILMLFALGGCSMFIAPPLDPVVIDYPDETVESKPAPTVAIPLPAKPPEIPRNELRVAIVITDQTLAFADVAAALQQKIDDLGIYDLSDRSMTPKATFRAIADSGANAVVAIGLPAARAAKTHSSVPVVVSQVFNVHQDDLLTDDIKAVSMLPPIELQIEAWQEIDPELRNVAAILGPGHGALIAQTEQAMKNKGIKFHYATAGSDRETLYIFNRLARDIDGYLLFPDNRILSRSVLAEMMEYASRHRIQVAVFNQPLLDAGATFSSESVSSDIAATILNVLEDMINGDREAVRAVTGLSKIDVQTNPAVLRRYGLAPGVPSQSVPVAENQ